MAEKNFDITIGDWSGGINTYDRPRQLAENESQTLENFEIVGRGGIELRRGYDILSSGGSSSDGVRGLLPFYKKGTSSADYLCIFNNAKLYTITPTSSTWTDQGSYGTDDGSRVGGTVFNNLAIFGNGYDGTIVDLVESGTYKWTASGSGTNEYYCELDAGGDPSITTPLEIRINDTIATEGTAGSLSAGEWDYGDNDTLGYSTVYVRLSDGTDPDTKADGYVQNYYVGTNNVKKFDGSTLGNLGGSPPYAQYFTHNQHNVFAWGVGEYPSIMYWTDLDTAEAWISGIASNQEIALNDGSDIQAIAIHNNDILAFKDFDKYGVFPVLDGTSDLPLGYVSKEIADGSDGTSSPLSLAKVWDGVYFLGQGDKGFQKYGLQDQLPDRRNPQSLSFKIGSLIQSINQSAIAKATAMFYNNKYFCSVPLNTSSTNTATFVYDTIYQGWTLFSYAASAFAIFKDEDGKRVPHFGSEASGTLYRFNNQFIDAYNTTSGEGFAIHGKWLSKRFRLPEKLRRAKIIVEGACTKPCYAELFVNVRYTGEGEEQTSGDLDDVKTKGQKTTKSWPITEAQVYVNDDSPNYSGGIISGETPSGIGSGSFTQMYDFKKVIYVDTDLIDSAEDIEFGLDIDKTAHGIRLDYVRFEGTISN